MDLWHLRTFRTVARTLHFTRASEELNLSQPAVSHQIKSLERELGEQLFVRGRNKVSLTSSGEVMLEHVDKILDITDALRDEIEESRRKTESTVTLGMVSRGLDSAFSELYKQFKNARPDIKLKFRVEPDAAALRTSIRMGKINVGVFAESFEADGFVCVPYGRNRLMLVVGPGHPLAGLGLVGAKKLRNERWGLFDKGDPLRTACDEVLASAGIRPKSIFETNDGSVIRSLVTAGELIAFLPSTGIVKELEARTLVDLKIIGFDPEIEVYLVWKSGSKSSSLEALVRYMIERELPGLTMSKLNKSGKP